MSASIPKFEQARTLYRELNDNQDEAYCLGWLGNILDSLGEKQKALDYYAQALPLRKSVGDKRGEATTLNNIGAVYDDLGEKQKALDYYAQSLPLVTSVGDKSGEATTLTNIGAVYDDLGEKQKALDYYAQALPLYKAVGDKRGEATTLNNIGGVYSSLGEKQKALDYYNQALPLHKAVGDKRGEATTLNNIGGVYSSLGEKQKALDYYNQALPLHKAVSDKSGEATTLNNIGSVYNDLGKKQKALDYFNQSLPLRKAVGDKDGEAGTLNNLMVVWEDLQNPRVAAFYGKQSVNKYQELRQNIKGLDKDTQKTYLKSVEYTYRDLADILIAQGRIAEAEQVLGMLKEEEYLSYLRRDDKVAADLKARLSLSPDEKTAFADYEKYADEITHNAQEFEALKKKIPVGESVAALAPDEQVKYKDLETKYNAAVGVFNKFLEDLKDKFAQKVDQSQQIAAVESDTIGLLKQLNQPHTVIISTIAGEDRLNLIVTTSDIQRAHTVNITDTELNKLVADFRQAVQNPKVDPRALGKQLYDKLFPADLQKDLDNIQADTIVWSLDGTLRYVPMSALWDGRHYLVERYSNAVITLASRDKLTGETGDRRNWRALGVGVSKQFENFPPLAAVPQELCGVVKDAKTKQFCDTLGEQGIFSGVMLRDEDFTIERFQPSLGKSPLVHIASHFSLNVGDYKDSYLLLGGGANRHFSLDDLRKTRLDSVQLLTLSACNTAMTSGANSSGVEVEGFGALAQKQGAKTVLATLWSVADDSTRDLMTAFYGKLETDAKTGKAEALRKAQLELMYGKYTAEEAAKNRGTEIINLNGTANTQPAFKPDANAPFAHPYYWSPFILFGNWR